MLFSPRRATPRIVKHALIISAKYGILRADIPIPPYDQRMTRGRALELRPAVARDLDTALTAAISYTEIFVNLGKTYRLAIAGSIRLREARRVLYASGGIGTMMAQMKAWLPAPAARHAHHAPRGDVGQLGDGAHAATAQVAPQPLAGREVPVSSTP